MRLEIESLESQVYARNELAMPADLARMRTGKSAGLAQRAEVLVITLSVEPQSEKPIELLTCCMCACACEG